MNYRHSYHAGNFADVFKHVILVALIQHLLRKESAFCYLDTHAGIGLYDLLNETTQKSKEYEAGIVTLIKQNNLPALLQDYLSCVMNYNSDSSLHYYPGSPVIARHFLRPQDRMVLSELHPEDFQKLKQFFINDNQVAIHHQDGYQSLKALLPPKERRGLVLIDPPFEQNNEFQRIVETLQLSLKKWENGCYAIWYPIKTRPPIDAFHRELKTHIERPILVAEILLYPESSSAGLNGCGMAIINPPWQLDEQLKIVLPLLWKSLDTANQGKYLLKNLK